MADWIGRLDALLQFNQRDILQNVGKVSQEVARRTATAVYKQYDARRRELDGQQDSDFDRLVKHITQQPKPDDQTRGDTRP